MGIMGVIIRALYRLASGVIIFGPAVVGLFGSVQAFRRAPQDEGLAARALRIAIPVGLVAAVAGALAWWVALEPVVRWPARFTGRPRSVDALPNVATAAGLLTTGVVWAWLFLGFRWQTRRRGATAADPGDWPAGAVALAVILAIGGTWQAASVVRFHLAALAVATADEPDEVRTAYARYQAFHRGPTPGSLYRRFFEHRRGRPVLLHLAHNAAVPEDVWLVLARDPDTRVADEVVRGPAVTAARVAQLTRPSDHRARQILAFTSGDKDVLRVLEGMGDVDLANHRLPDDARARVEARVVASPDVMTRLELAQGIWTTPDTLRRLAGDPESSVRDHVAANYKAPVDVLVRLAGDSVGSVRAAVARNRRTPDDTLRSLANDPERYVALEARRRLRMSDPVR